jgi:hypothetical protein
MGILVMLLGSFNIMGSLLVIVLIPSSTMGSLSPIVLIPSSTRGILSPIILISLSIRGTNTNKEISDLRIIKLLFLLLISFDLIHLHQVYINLEE